MPEDDFDLFESILLNVQIIALDSPHAADYLHAVGENLGDEYLYIAANFIVAQRLELMDAVMPDAGLLKWLDREYPRLRPYIEEACRAYIEDTAAKRDAPSDGASEDAAAAD